MASRSGGGTDNSSSHPGTMGGASEPKTVVAATVPDPEGDVACNEEPGDGAWSEIELSPGLLWQLAFARHRAIVTCVDDDQLFARVSDDSGKSWSAPTRIDTDASKVGSLGVRVLIAPDASSAFAYWQSTGASRWVSRYDSAHGWSAPMQVAEATSGGSSDPFPDEQLIVLSNGKAVLAHEATGKTSGIEYRLFDGTSWGEVKSFPNGQFTGLFLGQNEVPALYTEEADPIQISPARRTLDLASGWSQPEFIPYEDNSGAYQLIAFEGLNGHAARVRRGLGSEGVRISVREGGTWGPDEALGEDSRNLLDLPRLAEAGNELLAAWSRPSSSATDDSELFLASRAAGIWRSVAIARAHGLSEVTLAGSQTGAAVLIGNIDRFPEPSLTKIFRRNKGGAWYCPRVEKGQGDAVAAANDEGTLLVAVLGDYRSATLLRFEPK